MSEIDDIYDRYVALTGDDYMVTDTRFINELRHRKNFAIAMMVFTAIFGVIIISCLFIKMNECKAQGKIAARGSNGIECFDEAKLK